MGILWLGVRKNLCLDTYGYLGIVVEEKFIGMRPDLHRFEFTGTFVFDIIRDEIFGEKCEHHYIQPTFITDYPKEMSPLCKTHRNNSKLTERFELMVNGKELANAYSELNDPIDQRERFEDQLKLQQRGDDEAMFIDHDFLRALEYGMPPTAGIGIGIDRLTMLLTNNVAIQEVLFFPQMRPEKVEVEEAHS